MRSSQTSGPAQSAATSAKAFIHFHHRQGQCDVRGGICAGAQRATASSTPRLTCKFRYNINETPCPASTKNEFAAERLKHLAHEQLWGWCAVVADIRVHIQRRAKYRARVVPMLD